MKLLGESCAFHILSWSNKQCCQKWPSGLFLPFWVGRVIYRNCVGNKPLCTAMHREQTGHSGTKEALRKFKHSLVCMFPSASMCIQKQIVLVQGSSSPFVKRVICRDRFNKLNQYLHLNNKENFVSRGERNHTKLFQICLFLEAVIKGNSQRISP